MVTERYILVLRLSAMGDVALITPVLRAVDKGEYKIIVVTRPLFASFFYGLEGIEVFIPDFKVRHHGISGIFRLYRDIKQKYNISLVIDLHSVIRTWILGLLFSFWGRKLYRINKDRKKKKKFIRSRVDTLLPHITERYSDVFRRAGFEVGDIIIPSFITGESADAEALAVIDNYVRKGSYLIGISPFAKHRTKEWGLDNIRHLMLQINKEYDVFFIFFGGRDDYKDLLLLASSFSNCYIAAGRHDLSTELALIRHLSLMISMDSSNMHLAALSGIPTLSIWGGTHPSMGFSPSGDQQHIIIETPNSMLGCRPCSIYGSKDCIRKDLKYKCMKMIRPEDVLIKLQLSDHKISNKK